jgi:hypothetical protein
MPLLLLLRVQRLLRLARLNPQPREKKSVICFKVVYEGSQVSISPTFNVRFFVQLCAAFFYLHLRFALFWPKNIGAKAAFRFFRYQFHQNFLSSFFSYESYSRSFLILEVWIYSFWRKIIGEKLLLKCW